MLNWKPTDFFGHIKTSDMEEGLSPSHQVLVMSSQRRCDVATHKTQNHLLHKSTLMEKMIIPTNTLEDMVLLSRCHSWRRGSAPASVFHFRPWPGPLSSVHVGLFILMPSVITLKPVKTHSGADRAIVILNEN